MAPVPATWPLAAAWRSSESLQDQHPKLRATWPWNTRWRPETDPPGTFVVSQTEVYLLHMHTPLIGGKIYHLTWEGHQEHGIRPSIQRISGPPATFHRTPVWKQWAVHDDP